MANIAPSMKVLASKTSLHRFQKIECWYTWYTQFRGPQKADLGLPWNSCVPRSRFSTISRNSWYLCRYSTPWHIHMQSSKSVVATAPKKVKSARLMVWFIPWSGVVTCPSKWHWQHPRPPSKADADTCHWNSQSASKQLMKTSSGWRNSKMSCHLPPVGIRASANSPGNRGALSRRLLPSELQNLQLWDLRNQKFKVLNGRGNFRRPRGPEVSL